MVRLRRRGRRRLVRVFNCRSGRQSAKLKLWFEPRAGLGFGRPNSNGFANRMPAKVAMRESPVGNAGSLLRLDPEAYLKASFFQAFDLRMELVNAQVFPKWQSRCVRADDGEHRFGAV